jgi:hypothetical protein
VRQAQKAVKWSEEGKELQRKQRKRNEAGALVDIDRKGYKRISQGSTMAKGEVRSARGKIENVTVDDEKGKTEFLGSCRCKSKKVNERHISNAELVIFYTCLARVRQYAQSSQLALLLSST